MTAFSDKRAGVILNSVRQLFQRVQMYFECDLRAEEVQRMLIPTEQRAVLDQAYSIMYGTNHYVSSHNVNVMGRIPSVSKTTEVQIYSSSGFMFLLPNSVKNRPYQTLTPSDETAKVESWLEHRAQLGVEWGRVLDVFNFLNDHCETPQQMRFYFPGIVTLMVNSGDDGVEQMGNKLRTVRKPNHFLALNREIKEYLGQANATLATVQLLLQSSPPPRPDVRLSVSSIEQIIRPVSPLRNSATPASVL